MSTFVLVGQKNLILCSGGMKKNSVRLNLHIRKSSISECESSRKSPPSIERRIRGKKSKHKYKIMRQYTSQPNSK
jgi:hypothetical protein